MNPRRLIGCFWIFAAAAASSIGGVCFLSIPLMSLASNSIRCGIAAIISILFLKKDGKRFCCNPTTLVGGLCFALTTQFFSLAVPLAGAGISTLLLNTSPLFVLLFQSIANKKIPALYQIGCAVLVLTGIFVLVQNRQSQGSLLGVLFGLCSGACYSGIFLAAQGVNADAPSAFLTGQLLGCLVGLPFLFRSNFGALSFTSILALATLGIVQLGLSYRCMAKGLLITPPLTASLICNIEPVLAALWAAIFVGEQLGPSFVVGSGMVLCGIVAQQVFSQHNPKITGTIAEHSTPLNTDSTTVSSSV